jgi:hypothetical protein
MKQRFLEITYRKGKPLAAYLYLVRQQGDTSTRTERHPTGLIIDFTADDRAMGIEITAPSRISLADMNAALAAAKQDPISAADIAPLLTSCTAKPV